MIFPSGGVDQAVGEIFDSDTAVKTRRKVPGGDINDSFLLTLTGGHQIFLKENTSRISTLFLREAQGLAALAAVPGAPPVPRPLAAGVEGSRSYLLLEYVPSQAPPGDLASSFAASLAALHREGRGEYCGFSQDNWIGTTPQSNKPGESWFDFFRDQRLGFQWELARQQGYGDRETEKRMTRLMGGLEDHLPPLDQGKPSLLHGDLWGGNWLAGTDGRGWIIDPAVYYGHREADLAMTELFGGFPPGFTRAYQEAWPLEPGFPQRRDLYNLYHILNHLNLFGRGYWGQVQSVIRTYA